MPLPGSPVVSPRLAAFAAAACPSTCTVQTATLSEPSPYGSQTSTWADVDGHVDLPCRIAPVSGVGTGAATSGEVRGAAGVYDVDARTVYLPGYYPTITEADRVVVDAEAVWDIVDVSFDGDRVSTRLRVRKLDAGDELGS